METSKNEFTLMHVGPSIQLSPHKIRSQLYYASHACCNKTCFLGILMLLIFATSLGALVMSMVALEKSEKAIFAQQNDNDYYFVENREIEQNTLTKLQLMLEDMGEMTFDQIHPKVDNSLGDRSQRSTEIEDLCYSSNETDSKPLAHIISSGTNYRKHLPNDGAIYSVLTKGWSCGGKPRNHSIVQGGMIFHRKSGFLEVPVTGVYYVYSQVTFRPGRGIARRAMSRLVACIPGARCSYPTEDDVYMQTETGVVGTIGNSKFQAGVFYFPSGTQIAILVWNEINSNQDLPSREKIRYDQLRYNTYFGAFLVDEDTNYDSVESNPPHTPTSSLYSSLSPP